MPHKKYHLGVKGLIRNKEGKILLLLKSENRAKKYGQKPYWDLPGGRISEGKNVEETLKQEFREEIGLKNFKNKGLFYAVVSNIEIETENCGLILFIYDCVPRESFQVKLDDEHSEYKWASSREASELLKDKYPDDFVEKIKKL